MTPAVAADTMLRMSPRFCSLVSVALALTPLSAVAAPFAPRAIVALQEPQEAPQEAPRAPPRGVGMLAAGIPLIVVGAGMFVAGSVFLSNYQACNFPCDNDSASFYRPLGLGVMLPGLAVLGGGITLTVLGVLRRRAHRQWRDERSSRLQPWGGRSPLGTHTVGFSLAF